MENLRDRLRRIDGRGYKAYKGLEGRYGGEGFTLEIDHVQGDPFAAPSRINLLVGAETAALPEGLWGNPVRRTALEDFLGRAVAAAIARIVRGQRGLGRSGEIAIAPYGQEILRRNAVLIDRGAVEVRLTVGLPARGRTISGGDAEAMLCSELPAIVAEALHFSSLDPEAARRHVQSTEDQDSLRRQLAEAGLVAFLADGSRLPRASGIDDRPLPGETIPLRAPPSLARQFTLPDGREICGLGIPRGVTLIVGGGFHGKSTLLHALERGVYNHIPGDGREGVVCDAGAVKIRAEDGRAIRQVDISPFITNLPLGRDTRSFSTQNASGSTSQAANIMEALEVGAGTLLIDEDTSATNFMIRDGKMQQLVAAEKEPITPLLHRVRDLYRHHGVSTVIVMGGSGDYLAVADTVLMLDTYRVLDVTTEARALAGEGPPPAKRPLATSARRPPDPRHLDPASGSRKARVLARGTTTLLYGGKEIELSRIEQLVDTGQTRAIGWLIRYYRDHWLTEEADFASGLRRALAEVERQGLDLLPPWKEGDLALPRLHEVAAAINRLR